jgi:hypothetical protein
MITEAIALKVMMEEKDREKYQEAEDWKKDKEGFQTLRERAES